MRNLSDVEMAIVTRLANQLDGPERSRLLNDLAVAKVCEETPDRAHAVFEIAGYVRPRYMGQHPFRVEGRILDRDGAELTVLLHADENVRLLELEFIRWDAGDMIEPRLDTLTLS